MAVASEWLAELEIDREQVRVGKLIGQDLVSFGVDIGI